MPQPSLPLRISRYQNLRLMLGMMLILIGYVAFREAMSAPPDLGAVLHSTDTWVGAAILVMLGAMEAMSIRRKNLTMDETGIGLTGGGRAYLFAWPDILGVAPAKQGVRLTMIGQSEAQNLYNLLPSNLGVPQGALIDLVDEGRRRWGERTATRPSFTPGNEARRIVKTGRRNSLVVFGLMFFGLLGGLFGSILANQLQHDDLMAHGVRAEARVVRLYTGDCGKRGCSRKVEYAYRPPGRSRDEIGYDALATGPNEHPDRIDYATTRGVVPIVYDPRAPSRSGLDFPSSRTHVRLSGVIAAGVLVFGVGGVFCLLILGMVWRAARRDLDRLPPA